MSIKKIAAIAVAALIAVVAFSWQYEQVKTCERNAPNAVQAFKCGM